MTRTRFASVVLAVTVLAAGCAVRSTPPWVVAGAQPIAAADPGAAEKLFDPAESWSGNVTIAAVRRPPIPHAGLQLPRVSPDGKWIATLRPIAPEAGGFDPSSLIDGDGLMNVQLLILAVDGETPQQEVLTSAPCWPTWLDNDRLMFVSYDERGGSALAMFDRKSGQVQRKSFGLRHMFAPAPHPGGGFVAVCGWGNVPDESVIFLADLAKLQLHPGPPLREGGGAQIFPRWVNNETLVYLELGEDHASLMRWTVGEASAVTVAQLAAPPSVHDAQHVLGGIGDPLSLGLNHYAAYLPAHDAIVLTDLGTGRSVVTRRSTRSGAWWTDQWFIASREDQVDLVHVEPEADEAPPKTMTLLNGPWAPVWTDPEAKSLILVGPSDDPEQLNVTQLWLVLEEELE